MFKFALIATTALVAFPHLASAEPVTEVIVTITRQPLPVSRTGQAVAVLDEIDIANDQSVTLADLLTHTPSLSLTRNGGPGAAASASIRGAGADHTLYLIDGVRLNDPSQVGGGSNLGLIATDDAARIEVLRGPLSTLWGSGALGGVVSILTREATAPLEGQMTVEGLDDYSSARVTFGGRSGRLIWRLFGNALKDDGVSAFAGGSEPDAFSQSNLAGRVSLALTDDTTVRAWIRHSRSRNAYDGYPAPDYQFADTDELGRTSSLMRVVSVHNRFATGEHTASLSETEADRHDVFADGSEFIAKGRIQSADYHVLYRPSEDTRLLGGLSYQRESMTIARPAPWDPAPVPLRRAVTTASLYGQVTQSVGPASLALSARHEDASSFGAFDFAQLSLSVPVGPASVRASAGTGIKVPSLYQLYSDYGTAGLVPETGVTIDAGADYVTDNSRFGITVFRRTVHDLINFSYDGCAATQLYGCYGNIDRSTASGVELTGRYATGAWSFSGNYSVLKTQNQSPGMERKVLPHAPEQVGSIDIGYQASQRLSLGLGLRHVADSFDNAANTRVLDGYQLVDLRAGYDVNDRVRLYGRIENLTDVAYETAGGYGQPGRRLWLGVSARLF